MRAALESDDFLALPDKFEIHEWAIMERFANGQVREARRDELLDAIHGAGAFRSFRSAVRRLRIEEEWCRDQGDPQRPLVRNWALAHLIFRAVASHPSPCSFTPVAAPASSRLNSSWTSSPRTKNRTRDSG